RWDPVELRGWLVPDDVRGAEPKVAAGCGHWARCGGRGCLGGHIVARVAWAVVSRNPAGSGERRRTKTQVLPVREHEIRGYSGANLTDRLHGGSRIRDLGGAGTRGGVVGCPDGEGPGTRHHSGGHARPGRGDRKSGRVGKARGWRPSPAAR